MTVCVGSSSTITLSDLLDIRHKNIKEFELKARELVSICMESRKIYTIFRIAKELRDLYCDIDDIEDFIINTRDPFYIFKFAKDIKSNNIDRLQQAIIETKQYHYIAKFACFVGGVDTDLLENIIISSGNANAAYIYLRFGKHPNVQKLRHILINSKKPRYLYALAQHINCKQDLNLIQDLIIAGKSDMYVRLFASHIPGADIQKLEHRILETKNFEEIKKFAKTVKSEKLKQLVLLM